MDIAPGSHIAQYVFISFKSFISRKLGIMPAFTSIVNVIIIRNTFRPTRRFLDSAYAPSIVIIMHISVPTSVSTTVFFMARIIGVRSTT